MTLRIPRAVLVGAIVALLAGAAGAAIAGTVRHQALSGNGAITACIHDGNGQLRVVADPNSCDGTSASWTAQYGLGPAVGDVFTTSNSLTTLPPLQAVEVAHLNLPPGSYLLLAKVHVETSGEQHLAMSESCTLSAGEDSDHAQFRSGDVSGFFWRAMLPLQLVHTFASGGRATLTCVGLSTDDDGNVTGGTASLSRLTALTVGNVTQQ